MTAPGSQQLAGSSCLTAAQHMGALRTTHTPRSRSGSLRYNLIDHAAKAELTRACKREGGADVQLTLD